METLRASDDVGDAQRHGPRKCRRSAMCTATGSTRWSPPTTTTTTRCAWGCAGSRAWRSTTASGSSRRARNRSATPKGLRRGAQPSRRGCTPRSRSRRALGELVRERRDALWQVADTVRASTTAYRARRRRRRRRDLAAAPAARRDPVGLPDERSLDARPHPLAPLRGELRARGWPDARVVSRGRDGQRLDYVGIVICRQQPGTAAGRDVLPVPRGGLSPSTSWCGRVFPVSTVARTGASLLGVSN